MKKSSIFLLAFMAMSANAKLSDAEILELFSMPGGIETSIESRTQLEGTNYEKIILVAKGKNSEAKQIFFSDGTFLFPDVIDPKNKISHAGIFNEKQEAEQKMKGYVKLSQLLKDYPKDKIIDLGDKGKELMYVFTDPLCPYCKEALNELPTMLKEFRLKLVFTPIPSHGEDAVARSIAIQKEMKTAKNDEQKLEILHKYYDKNNQAPQVSAEDIRNEQKLIMSVFETGAIRGVPATIEASSLNLK